jgi:hypothetical protein
LIDKHIPITAEGEETLVSNVAGDLVGVCMDSAGLVNNPSDLNKIIN